MPADHTRKASDPGSLGERGKKRTKWITHFLLFDKKEPINLHREYGSYDFQILRENIKSNENIFGQHNRYFSGVLIHKM